MKEKIHPKYEVVIVTCSCGNTFETRSTVGRKDLHIEICSECHPFYTGKQKLVDTSGRVERFKQRYTRKPAAPKPSADTQKSSVSAGAKKSSVSKNKQKPSVSESKQKPSVSESAGTQKPSVSESEKKPTPKKSGA